MADFTIHEGSPFVHFDGMVWPIPGSRLRDLEHALRYTRKDYCFGMEDRLLAASVINAYIELVWKTQKRRNQIATNLFAAAQND
jgi:hypothetical protein